jgi:hypothetical protein
VDWFDLAQDRYRWSALVTAVMNLGVPYNCGKLPSGCTIGGHHYVLDALWFKTPTNRNELLGP